MKVRIEERFYRDLKRIRSKRLRRAVLRLIEQAEQVSSPFALPHITKLQGYANYYRIRIGEYRIGLVLEGDTLIFVRCLHRKDIYRYFP